VGDRPRGGTRIALGTTLSCTAPGAEPRWGTPVASYVAGPLPDRLLPDARPLDRGKPRDESTEGGTQPADKSLINRRLDAFVPNPAQLQTYLIPAPQHADGLPVFLRSPRSATLDGDERS